MKLHKCQFFANSFQQTKTLRGQSCPSLSLFLIEGRKRTRFLLTLAGGSSFLVCLVYVSFTWLVLPSKFYLFALLCSFSYITAIHLQTGPALQTGLGSCAFSSPQASNSGLSVFLHWKCHLVLGILPGNVEVWDDHLWTPEISSDREWWCMNFEATASIPDILLGPVQH